jgi:NAD-dependent SIR2 family protein deacetylase
MNEMQQIARKIKDADAILIGAGNGLSITEGLHLFADNAAFTELFGDFKRQYGLRNILQGMMGRWPSEEEKWAFWSRLIHHYCGEYRETPVMADLKAIVGDKDYFIITSNGECHFEACGFAPKQIYEVEGNWLTMQCADACHDTLYPALEPAERMAQAEKAGRVPTELVPRCPRCGAPMLVSMAAGEPYLSAKESRTRYEAFLRQYHGKKLVVLELGIGRWNQLIKAPLMRLVAQEPNATYITINLGEIYIADNIRDKAFGLDGYLNEKLAEIRRACERL